MEHGQELTNAELEKIDQIQAVMHRWSRSIGSEGEVVEFLGNKFIVQRGVFWLLSASPLIKNFIINPGETVLDIGTGMGLIAVFAALKGADRVLAIDINPAAVQNAQQNVVLHHVDEIVEVRLSDMWESVNEEQFDVITANLPFREKVAADLLELSTWDSNFEVHKKFFRDVEKHLKPGGRIYLAQANFGNLNKVNVLAKESGFLLNKIAEEKMDDDPRVFYVFELKKL